MVRRKKSQGGKKKLHKCYKLRFRRLKLLVEGFQKGFRDWKRKKKIAFDLKLQYGAWGLWICMRNRRTIIIRTLHVGRKILEYSINERRNTNTRWLQTREVFKQLMFRPQQRYYCIRVSWVFQYSTETKKRQDKRKKQKQNLNLYNEGDKAQCPKPKSWSLFFVLCTLDQINCFLLYVLPIAIWP